MRATLWQGTGEASEIVREILRGLFTLAGIDFEVVNTQADLLAATARSHDHDILVIDCFHGEPGDVDRCAAIVTQTTLPVHIVHPREQTIHDLEEIAGRPLIWLPANATITVLLDKLHAFRALAAAEKAQVERPTLTPRVREVAELLAAGKSNGEIADQLHMTRNTVKSHVHALLAKFSVRTRAQFGAAYRSGEIRR